MAEDLRFASLHLPGVKLMFYDPNFGVRFDETLATFESIPAGQRSPYIMQTSLALPLWGSRSRTVRAIVSAAFAATASFPGALS